MYIIVYLYLQHVYIYIYIYNMIQIAEDRLERTPASTILHLLGAFLQDHEKKVPPHVPK